MSSTALTSRGNAVQITSRDIFHRWWPLALSWFFMALELPLACAVLARMANPEVELGAFGGIIIPVAFLIEAPVIMMLSAATALVRSRAQYLQIRRYTITIGGILALFHLLVAATPIYDIVTHYLLGSPAQLAEAGRVGLLCTAIFTPAVGYRRFQQGVLIRLGKTRPLSLGSAVRIAAIGITLIIGARWELARGATLGAIAMSMGVVAEALFVQAIIALLRDQLPEGREVSRITFGDFLSFYTPLALTSLIYVAFQPIGSAAISRMPEPVQSLAVWPAVAGFLFLCRSFGVAYQEVVISYYDCARARPLLRRFAWYLGVLLSLLLAVFTFTGIATWWAEDLTGLQGPLGELARTSLVVALPWPLIATLISWHQARVMTLRLTRIITGAVFMNVTAASAFLLAVTWLQVMTGLHAVITASMIGAFVQLIWLSRVSVLRGLANRRR